MNADQQTTSSGLDSVEMLNADHQKVKGLFDQLVLITKRGASDEEKIALVAKIRDELTNHESVENGVFSRGT